MKDTLKLNKIILPFLVVLWTSIIFLSALYQINSHKNTIVSIATQQAKTAYEKDFIYRLWASLHGGVYVPITDKTPPNPALAHIPNRDLETISGMKLTLVNPAYMTRQVHELGQDRYDLKGHITSLNPINKLNSPDEWERRALEKFEDGELEITEIVNTEGKNELRYMKALLVESSCLKCHAIQGYKIGEIRGGLGVSLPLTKLEETFLKETKSIIVKHIIVWFLVILLIFFIYKLYKTQFNLEKSFTYELAQAKQFEQNEKEYLSIILKSIGNGIIATDINGIITKINEVAENLTGYTFLEAKGKHISTIFTISKNTDVKENILIFDKIMEGEEQKYINQDYQLTSKNGATLQIHCSGTKIMLSKNETLGAVFIFRDITNEIFIKNQILQTQKLESLGQLTNGIAHDFNNLINGIMGGTEILQHHLENDVKSQQFLSLIMDSSLKAADMTKKLLAFSRVPNINFKPFSVHDSITASCINLKNIINENITIITRLKANEFIVLGDTLMLQNIIINMGINSSHALALGGEITFETSNVYLDDDFCSTNPFKIVEGKYIQIEIHDNGTGITEENLPLIFDPYFTTKKMGNGKGLGLSVVYGNIIKLKGSITVLSKKGKGTTFTILLPLKF